MSGGITASSEHRSLVSWSADRDRILARYLELLAAADSPLLEAGPATMRQVRAQLYDVIDCVAREIDSPRGNGTGATVSEQGLSETIGRSRASGGIHPSQSLQAATLIFEAALPTIAARLAAAGDDSPEMTAALLLNREILHRMATAARAYVDHLLDKAQRSHSDERRRLSRELHDVAAPAVAVGLQNLELFDLYSESEPDKASAKIQGARQSMLDALMTIRGLSAQSRENVGKSGLETAIRRYLDTLPVGVRAEVTITGDLSTVSLAYAEELFLIVREAARNAVDHGHPRNLTIEIEAAPGELRAEIHDDGVGFAVPAVLAGSEHVGIDSMRERAELLGAQLTITSRPARGTTVAVRISLPFRPDAPARVTT